MMTPRKKEDKLLEQLRIIHLSPQYTLINYGGNITFIVTKVPIIVGDNAEDNSWYRWDNNSVITRISSL